MEVVCSLEFSVDSFQLGVAAGAVAGIFDGQAVGMADVKAKAAIPAHIREGKNGRGGGVADTAGKAAFNSGNIKSRDITGGTGGVDFLDQPIDCLAEDTHAGRIEVGAHVRFDGGSTVCGQQG